MQRTRRAILDYLKRKPGATLQELATAGGIAPITARSHLAILLDAGLVQATAVRQGRGRRGRPARRYSLTEAADAYFPKGYDRLALSLLAGLSQLEGDEALEALVEHVAGGMAAGYGERVEGKSLPERVAAIAEIIEEQGGAAEWAPTAEGYVVREHNCPYLSVSRCDDHVCEIDRRLVQRLAGAPVAVTQRLRDGADSCDFVIAAPEGDRPAPG
jgi:predicted ArsR family transcriptional regulator